jgi:hypothetical protein
MNKIALLLVTMMVTVSAWSGQVADLPTDDRRGRWIDTIDEDARSYAYNRQSALVRKGASALRFELRHGDCYTAVPAAPATGWDDCTRERERTEIREKWSPKLDTEVWYAFSVHIPKDYTPMYPKQIFFQWHNGVWGPNVYFQLNKNTFLIDILTQVDKTTQQFNLGQLEKGVWHDFTVRAVWSSRDTGKLSVYRNSKPVLEYTGPTMDADSYSKGAGPHVKMGLYVSHLSRWTSKDKRPTRVIYFDEYRRGYSANIVDIRKNQGD